jgi:hypothetical protein
MKKHKFLSTAIITSFIIFVGCEFDNYNPPTSFLSGNVVYNGIPVGVRSGGTELELWEYNWKSSGIISPAKIRVQISQNGSYSARLFDGDYKLVRVAGAPWINNNTDTISVTVKGNTKLDVPVVPYFIITDEVFTYDPNNSMITSSCNVDKIGTINIESLTLYVSFTEFVDANNYVQSHTLQGGDLDDLSTIKTNTITLSNVTPYNMASREFIFARIGVKTLGVSERLYTPVQKIVLN